MLKTFKYRLYPSRTQERLLEQTLETCRRWYNICLEERQTAWEERCESLSQYAQLSKVKDLKDTNPYASNIHSHDCRSSCRIWIKPSMLSFAG